MALFLTGRGRVAGEPLAAIALRYRRSELPCTQDRKPGGKDDMAPGRPRQRTIGAPLFPLSSRQPGPTPEPKEGDGSTDDRLVDGVGPRW